MNTIIHNILSFIHFQGEPFMKRTKKKIKFKVKKPGQIERKKVFESNSDFKVNFDSKINTAIIFIAHEGVWHEEIWENWKQDTPVYFFVHQDSTTRFSTQSSFGIKVENPVKTKRGRKSHLQAILHSLEFAKQWGIVNDKIFDRFYILSGDTLPIQTVYHFLDEKKFNSKESFLAYHKQISDEKKDTYIQHNMEMILCKKHVELICSLLIPEVKITDEEHPYNINDRKIEEFERQPDLTHDFDFEFMDEYVIGSFLYDIGETFQNKAISGWISKNETETLRSIEIQFLNQKLYCEDGQQILAPNPEDGTEHIILFTGTKDNKEYNCKEIIEGILYGFEPWDEFLTFRKIIPFNVVTPNKISRTHVSNLIEKSIMNDTYFVQKKYELMVPI